MIKLRTANKADIPSIMRIYSHYVLKTAVSFEYQLPSTEAFTQKFERIKYAFPWLICDINGVVAGYAYVKNYYEDAAYAWSTEISVYVDEGYQRKGIATFFYQCVEQFLILQGYYNLYASITGTNEKSLKFHNALGFEAVGTCHNVGYKLGAWHNVVWFEKKLQEYAADPRQPTDFSLLDKDMVDRILLDYTETMNEKIVI